MQRRRALVLAVLERRAIPRDSPAARTSTCMKNALLLRTCHLEFREATGRKLRAACDNLSPFVSGVHPDKNFA
jgi:hypothetical protein